MNNVQETVEMMNELSNKGFDNLRALGELQMNTWNKLMDKQMKALNSVIDTAVAQSKLATEGKDYQDVVEGQVELARKLSDELVGQARESVELAQAAGEEFKSWAEKVAGEVTEQVQEVAEKVKAA